jgi:DNA-binding NarL/FixJ family response regulator
MPVMDGAQAYPLLMEARPNLKVLIASGYELDPAAQSLLDAGASAFIQKPFRAHVLAATVRRAIAAEPTSDG